MMLNQIKKVENLNNIYQYIIEKKKELSIFPIEVHR